MFKYLIASRLMDDSTQSRINKKDYDFFTFRGKTPIEFDRNGVSIMISRGDKFGVRKLGNKEIGLVKENDLNKEVIITYKEATKLAGKI